MSDLQIGKFIALLRKEKGMTQRELAEQLNLSDKAISKWERGESYPEITILPKLSALLAVSADELLAGERKKLEEAEVLQETNIHIPEQESSQAPSIIGKRILAYFVDSLLGILLALGFILIQNALFSSNASSLFSSNASSLFWNSLFQFLNTWILSLMGACGLYTWLFIWLFNGYTPGKWLFGLRVVKSDRSKITLGTAILRDFVIRGMAGLFSMCIFNTISFIFVLAGKENQALHDMAVHTEVISVRFKR